MKSQKKLDILAQTAHDMNAPLSVIQEFLRQIDSSTLENDMREFCAAARRSVERLLVMAESLKNTYTVNYPKRMTHDVAEIARLCIGEIRGIADDRGVEVRYVGPRKLRGMIDKAMFERVLTNMLCNSLQAIGNRGGRILVTLINRNGTICLDVADNGIGIDPNHLGKIFDRGFTRGDHKGTGIGLDTCRQIIEHHGGRIEVHSTKDVGTVFTLIFPSAALFADEDSCSEPSDLVVEGRNLTIIRWDDTLDPI